MPLDPAGEAPRPFLEARDVSKRYRTAVGGEVRALDAVSLAVPRGTFLALTGPSGSGKTTLLALLGALDRPTGGEVRFDGRPLNACSDVALARLRRRMGFIFQDFALIPGLPVWENITYPLIPRGIGRGRRQAVARALLARLGIPAAFAARPEQLSGGEQQRVAAARALAGEPEVLFADEPTSNLDPATARALMDLLRELHAAGTTVVVATHDPDLAALATAVRELRAGRLVLS
jgi:putative ABC transport system ATP-binding protein